MKPHLRKVFKTSLLKEFEQKFYEKEKIFQQQKNEFKMKKMGQR